MSGLATMVKFAHQEQQQLKQQELERRDDQMVARENGDSTGDASNSSSNNKRLSAGHFRMDSVAEPMARYLTLAASLTSQLGGGLKSRATRPPEWRLGDQGDDETQDGVVQPQDAGGGSYDATTKSQDDEASDELCPLKSLQVQLELVQKQAQRQVAEEEEMEDHREEIKVRVDEKSQQVAAAAAATALGSPAAAQKARPLNRVAMSRAKFAIRSYTIAVSVARVHNSFSLTSKRNKKRVSLSVCSSVVGP